MSKYKLKRRDFFGKVLQLVLGMLVIDRGFYLGTSSTAEILDKTDSATIDSALSSGQIDIIRSITGIIIPKDKNPGAKEAGIAEYIAQTLQFQRSEAIQQTKQVLDLIDLRAKKLFGKPYNQLSDANKNLMVDWLSSDRQMTPFWTKLRTMTVLRFYSLPLGYEPLGLPGPTIDQGGIPISRLSCS